MAAAPRTIEALKLAAGVEPRSAHWPSRGVVATVADVLDALASGDRQLSRTAFMVDEISKWCAAYFDEGQAAWGLPSRKLRPYAAWRATVRHDRTPEVLGIQGFRAAIAALPEDPTETIAPGRERARDPGNALSRTTSTARSSTSQGWAAYARYRVWDNALYGRADDTLVELLAIRIAWGYAPLSRAHRPALQGSVGRRRWRKRPRIPR